ncbi:DUF2207 family protein [Streptococcus porcinus]|uniref:Membrane protein n=1 Tax=Streptococcus porcinus TaxID=1340 RepID=A0A4V0H6J3_STRPO|nr:DUF2207 domain-containing protein [Streptococcus porcinus]VTT41960.1 membrane protein [Streptococcus porcinus]VTT43333.1 membrane protein [Streptococcus porcinus]
MVLKRFFISFIVFVSFFGTSVFASGVEYRIPLYEGHLHINEDNSAQFTQEVTYLFSTSYEGQYVSLGKAGKMPSNFDIHPDPQIEAYRNGGKVNVSSSIEDLGDGYRLKIYNAGKPNDNVKIIVKWKLSNILYKYKDIAVLNWKPISDWDNTLEKVHFTVDTQAPSKKQELYLHRGYFKPSANTSGLGQLETWANDVDGVSEFHAYWDSKIISGQAISRNYLPIFKATEREIAERTRWIRHFVDYYVYVIIAIFFIAAIICWLTFKKTVFQFKNRGKGQLYTLPDDLPPLVVAEKIFHLNLQKLNPANTHLRDDNISFENLVQATLLDLIDRKAIEIEKEANGYFLILKNRSVLTDFEESFVHMAFGDAEKLKTDQLFADYFFDSDISKKLETQYSGKELQRQVNARGKEHLNKLNHALKDLSMRVTQSIGSESDSYYRSMSIKEKVLFGFANLLLVIPILILIAHAVYAMIVTSGTHLTIDIVLVLIAILLMIYMSKKVSVDRLQGVLTQEGQQARQPWDSFILMLKDIKHFERAEIESLIVWNRVLVYASLFGFADQVERYMALHGIELTDQDLVHTYSTISPIMYGMTTHFTHSAQAATQASHFSVSSGSGGGFSGGGFSGGGGGGGGGAF